MLPLTLPSSISPLISVDQQPFDGQGLRVGVFDSGLGGLSILRAIRARMPKADILYVADSGHAPYGEKSDAFIEARSRRITAFLLERHANLIVVACNTATAAAVHHLRQQWPGIPVVGVEPGLKPAVIQSRTQRIGVLATPATLRSLKFQTLVNNHGGQAFVLLQPCPGLAHEIEGGELDTPALRALVLGFSAPLIEAGVDTAVLGCTHYPFVAPLFREALGPQVTILDTAEAVARQTAQVGRGLLATAFAASTGPVVGMSELWSSGQPDHLSTVAQRWLGLQTQASALPAHI